ncbi:hypothetical protein CR492_11735 [Methylocella silvestris]|uniref:Uncharacterized protein n=2 Tax=Methylocella silvestris TaxID=199596 RepID=A0A2J7TGA1_METSI|nr:hypothetical protein CR492_11735 [Methylocella silvestris]
MKTNRMRETIRFKRSGNVTLRAIEPEAADFHRNGGQSVPDGAILSEARAFRKKGEAYCSAFRQKQASMMWMTPFVWGCRKSSP